MTRLFKRLAKALAVPVVALMVPALAAQALAPFGHGTAHASSQAGSVEASQDGNVGGHHHSGASHGSESSDDHHGACKTEPSPACDIVVCCLGEPCVADFVPTARAVLAASLSAGRMGEPVSISRRPFEPPPRIA